ncbi:hypothetical protein J2Y63_003780 [Shinella sp. BE166]|uniref:hypothetical protein n=1 Tax=Shinella sp. BE166 TaxID=3373918 RepID=UPI003EBE859F
MLNAEYGQGYVCQDCTTVNERRHNGWIDPYSKPFDFVAANDNNNTKKCTACECDLPLADFSLAAKGGMGRASECKDCRAALRAMRDRSQEYARRDEVRGIDRIKSKRIRLIERANRRRSAERRANGRRIDMYLRRWRALHKKPWNAPGLSSGEKFRIRYANDNEFVLKERTRQRVRRKGFGFNAMWRMRQALYGDVGPKGLDTIERALGYSMSDLHTHLERLFVDGMSWEAFRSGRIHIDHKKPLSRFDLDDPEQLLVAWSLDNLQPLWAADNMTKGAKTDEEWRASA